MGGALSSGPVIGIGEACGRRSPRRGGMSPLPAGPAVSRLSGGYGRL